MIGSPRKTVAAGKGKFKRGPRRSKTGIGLRRKICRLCADKMKTVDYKDLKRLEAFITERGKILSSRISGNCAKHQRRVAEAVKKARFVSLLPYVR